MARHGVIGQTTKMDKSKGQEKMNVPTPPATPSPPPTPLAPPVIAANTVAGRPVDIDGIELAEQMTYNLGSALTNVLNAKEKINRLDYLLDAIWYINREIIRITGSDDFTTYAKDFIGSVEKVIFGGGNEDIGAALILICNQGGTQFRVASLKIAAWHIDREIKKLQK